MFLPNYQKIAIWISVLKIIFLHLLTNRFWIFHPSSPVGIITHPKSNGHHIYPYPKWNDHNIPPTLQVNSVTSPFSQDPRPIHFKWNCPKHITNIIPVPQSSQACHWQARVASPNFNLILMLDTGSSVASSHINIEKAIFSVVSNMRVMWKYVNIN